MTWLNPWAWLGLVAVGVPIAIHFLTRAQPRPQPFPTLRFLDVAQTSAMRRRVLRDRLLLAVRMAIVAAVVAAIAQPYVRTAWRRDAAAASLYRAVVIDTSASLDRPTPDGRKAIDVARERAATLQPAAAATTEIDATRLAVGIEQATTWLAERGGRGELVVVSDFQRGAMTDADLAHVSTTIGVRFIGVDVVASRSPNGPPDEVAGVVWAPHLSLDPDRTTVTWTPAGPGAVPATPVLVLAGPSDGSGVAAAQAASRQVGGPADAQSQGRRVAVVLPGAADRSAIVAGAGKIDEAWMFDAIARIGADAAVSAAASTLVANDRADAVDSKTGAIAGRTVLVRDASGAPLVDAVGRHGATSSELVLVAHSSDDLLLSALITAARAVAREPSAIRELEPAVIPAADLTRWQRPTPTVGAPAPDAPDASDGRWFWLAALVFFGVEGWMRRTSAAPAASEVAHARVA